MRWAMLLLVVLGLGVGPADARLEPLAKPVTRIEIHKRAHLMKLYAGDAEVAWYNVWIGPGGAGVKHQEGDRVTPVGHYHVNRRSPSRDYDLFLGIDYPNAEDRARFAASKERGELPPRATIGGNVGIHGGSPEAWSVPSDGHDWTLGCISVRNSDIEEIARVVRLGTPVEIED